MSKMKSIKVSEETKNAFDEIAEGMTQEGALKMLISMYNEKKNATTTQAKDGRVYSSISKEDRLRLFVDTIRNHNSQVAKKKSGHFIHLPSAFFVARETGLNSTRDVKPMWDKIEKDLLPHYAKLGIGSGVMRKDELQDKDEKSRLKYITKILKEAGVNEVFNR